MGEIKDTSYCERVAAYYDADDEEARFIPPYKNLERINTEYLLDRYVSDKSEVLDCAAGTGVYVDFFLKKGASVTASDMSHRARSITLTSATLWGKRNSSFRIWAAVAV